MGAHTRLLDHVVCWATQKAILSAMIARVAKLHPQQLSLDHLRLAASLRLCGDAEVLLNYGEDIETNPPKKEGHRKAKFKSQGSMKYL